MQAAEVIAETKPAPTSRPMWGIWLVLSALTLGGFAAIAFLVPAYEWAHVPVSPENFWIWRLRFEIMPTVGIAALVAPLAGLIFLLLRRWRPAVLTLMGVLAVAQFAYAGFEKYLQTADLPGPSLPEGMEDWPALQTPEGRAR